MSTTNTTSTMTESSTEFKDDRQVDMSLLVRGYEVVIGFETHAQLSTARAKFSAVHRPPLAQSPTPKPARWTSLCPALCP